MKTKLIIFAVVIIAAGLRIYNIEQKNLWFDEVYSWKISQGNVTQIVSDTSGDIHPPLFYIILKYWMKCFSDSIFAMRSLSLLLGILSMYFIYRISKLFLKSDLQVILVLLLYTFSPLNVYYSQEVRMLNLNLFLCLGSLYYFYCYLKTPSLKYGLLYLTYTVLALYTHYFSFLILFAEVIVILIFYITKKTDINTFKKYFYYLISINILYIPWYPVFFSQSAKGQPWRTGQNFMQVGRNIFDYFRDIFLSSYVAFESNYVYYFSKFAAILVIVFLIYSLFRMLTSKILFNDISNTITLFFFLPLIIASLISFHQSILLSRYLSILIPYLFITIVYFSFRNYKTGMAIAINVVLILVSCYGTYINFNNNFKNNDYRKIVSYLDKNFTEGDELLVEPHFMGWSIDYYLRHSESKIRNPEVLGWNLDMQLDSLRKTSIKKIWVILDYSSLEKGNYDSLTGQMIKMDYSKSSEKIFYLIPEKVKVNYYTKKY